MRNDILHIRVQNARSFYRNNMIGKIELEKQVEPYLKKHNMSFQEFLTEDHVRNISTRKNKRRIEKIKVLGMIACMIFGLYIVGDNDREVRDMEILAYR